MNLPSSDAEMHAFVRAAAVASRKSEKERSDDDVALIECFAAWRADGSKLMSTTKGERQPVERVRYFVDGRRMSDALSRIHEIAYAYSKDLVADRQRLSTKEFVQLLADEHNVTDARAAGWTATLRNGRRITSCTFDTTDEPAAVVVVEPEPEPEAKPVRKRAPRKTAAQKRAEASAAEVAAVKSGRAPLSRAKAS